MIKCRVRMLMFLRATKWLFAAVLLFIGFAWANGARAAVVTWDGGAADTNWNSCANWSGNACPTTSDVATFDATSTKDAVINAPLSVASIDINTGYSGTITQATGATISTSAGYAQDAGTFVGGDSAIALGSTFTLAGGSFTSTSASLTVKGTFTHNAGTFAHNNGTVRFSHTSGITYNTASTLTFYNVEVSFSVSGMNMSNDTMQIDGTLTLANGTLSAGTLNVKGAVNVASTWDGGSSLTILIDGTNTAAMTIAAGAQVPGSTITINNSNYNVVGSGSGTLTFDAVNLQAGSVNTSGFMVSHGAVTISGGTYTQGSGTKTFSGVFSQSGGVYDGGSSTSAFNNTFALTGGSHMLSSDATTFRNFTHTNAPILSHNNGTVRFSHTSGITYNTATTLTFYNVEVTFTAGSMNMSSDTMQIDGALTLTRGSLSQGTMNAKGAVNVAATWGGATNHTLLIDGTNTAAMTMAAGAQAPASTMTINNGNYDVVGSGSGTLTLGAVNLQAGNIDTSGFAVTHGVVSISGGTYTLGSGTKTFTGAFSQSGGNYNGGTSTPTFNSTFAISGGTHTLSSDVTTFRGSVTHTNSPTMSHSNGTVRFVYNSTLTYNTASTLTFYNVIFQPTASNMGMSGDTMQIDGTLTLTFAGGAVANGTFDVRGPAVTVTSGVTITPSLIFSGSEVTTFTLTGSESFYDGDITVNKTGGSVELGSSLTLNAASQDFVIQEGTFDLNGHNLTVNGTTGTLVVQDGGNLQLQGGEAITVNASNPQLLSGSTVTYDGTSSSYALKDYTYHHLAIAGGASSVFAPAANESLGGNLTINSGILDQATRTLAVTGTFSNNGTLRRRQTEAFTATMDTDSGTVEYVGDGDGSAEAVTITDFGGTDYYNLVINDVNATKDNFSLVSGLNVAGTLSVTSAALSQGGESLSAGGLTVNGGTFTGGSNPIVLSGAFALSSGAFTNTSGALSVGGNFTHTAGGMFTINGGSVAFTGNDATIDVATSESFLALTINKSSGQTLTIATGDTIIVTGPLIYADGAVSGGLIEAQGSVTVASGYDGGSAPLTFTGSSEQIFALTGATNSFDGDIEVDKTSGSVVLASALTMDAVGQDLIITSGAFSTGLSNYPLTVTGNVSVNGGMLSLGGATVDFNGDLTVAGGTLNFNTASVTIAGDVAYPSGSFNSGTSSVTLDGGDQELSGGTYWYNLTKNVASAATLTLPSGTTTTVSNILTLNGADGQLLALRSSTNDVQHLLAAALPGTFSYLDIKDSYTVTAQRCLTSTDDCVNSQGNTGWTFSIASGGGAQRPTGTVNDNEAEYAPVIIVTSPNGGEEFAEGDEVNMTWSVIPNGGIVNIFFSLDNGDSWNAILRNGLSNGVYTWRIPEDAVSAEAMVKVETTDLVAVTASDTSDDVFAIIAQDDEQDDEANDAVEVIAERIANLPASVAIHGLVKLADDGNSATQADSAVYYIGADGTRHAFPNEQVYRTWFCGFDAIQIVSAADLATVPLGTNVTYRPGARMVKFLSVPKVYAVDALGTLRWIASEEVAVSLYGTNWNTLIDDISDAFYGNYEFGTEIVDTAAYNADEAVASVTYPSDTIDIPGYSSAPSTAGLNCE